MPKKGQKKLRGQPEIYDEVKGHIGLSITKTGVQGLDELATSMGLSRSEFVEQIGRRSISVLSQEDKQVMEESINELIATAKDELLGQNLFEGQKAKGDRVTLLQQKLERWQHLLERLK